MRKIRKTKRIILDSNVWRYILDNDLRHRLVKYSTESGHQILACPAVIYEAMDLQDVDLRSRLVALMASRKWKNIMSEAFLESEEIVRSIRALRPGWVRANPDLSRYRELRRDWSNYDGGFWKRLRSDLDGEIQRINIAGGGRNHSKIVAQFEKAKKNLSAQKIFYDDITLDEKFLSQDKGLPGWHGDPRDFWRWTSIATMRESLSNPHSAHRDWMNPLIDVDKMLSDKSGYNSFWLYDVSVSDVPRQWIRNSFEFLQSTRKINSGTPCDSQISSYLLDCDAFITSDKTLHAISTRARALSPFSFATSHLVPAGAACLDGIIQCTSHSTDGIASP